MMQVVESRKYGAGCAGNIDIYDLDGLALHEMMSGVRMLSGVLSLAQQHYPENVLRACVSTPNCVTNWLRVIDLAIAQICDQRSLYFC